MEGGGSSGEREQTIKTLDCVRFTKTWENCVLNWRVLIMGKAKKH